MKYYKKLGNFQLINPKDISLYERRFNDTAKPVQLKDNYK